MITWHDIGRYFRLLLRWWSVLVLAVSLASGTALILARRQPNIYATRASLMVGDNFNAAAPNQFAFSLSNTLAAFYGELAHRETILKPVADQLQLPFAWQLVADRMLATSVNQQANLLEITVIDTDPQRAAAIANGIAQQLIAYSPNSPDKMAAQRAAVSEQLKTADANVKESDRKIAELQERLSKLTAAVDLKDVQDQIDQVQKSRDKFQDSYNQLLQLSDNTSINSLSLFEQAAVPTSAMPSRRLLTVGMAGAGGLLLAIVAILLLDRLDERWRNGRDLQDRIGLSDLGAIPGGPPLIFAQPANASHRERVLRDAHTRIMLAANGQGARTLLISSPQSRESRSVLAIDLADLFARAGNRVLIVDADLATPHLTQMMERVDERAPEGIEQTHQHRDDALARWVRPHAKPYAANIELWSRLRPTPLDNVLLLGRQAGADNLPLLVPSSRWPELVENLSRSADVVIFDGPSALNSADASLLAPLVDGVVLALDPNQDTRSAILESKGRLLQQQGARLLGAVVVQGNNKERKLQAQRKKASGITISVDLGGKPSRATRSEPKPASTPAHASSTASNSASSSGSAAARVVVPSERVIVPPAPYERVIVPPAPPSTIITPEAAPAHVIITPASHVDDTEHSQEYSATPQVNTSSTHGKHARRIAGRSRHIQAMRKSAKGTSTPDSGQDERTV